MSGEAKSGLDLMLSLVDGMPDDLAAAAGLPGMPPPNAGAAPAEEILVCGMGGSAIAADLISPLAEAAGVRITVWRDYGLPAWAGSRHLVVASSYSGETEETLSAVKAAAARGCPLLALTSGGTLAGLAAAGIEGGAPFPAVRLPGGMPPRASLGHGLGALLHALHRTGMIPDPAAEIADAVAVMRERRQVLGSAAAATDDPAAGLARSLPGRMAVVHTTSAETHAAGQRLKAQLNENAKIPACVAAYPELDHNEIVGWDAGGRLRDDFALLVLRSADESPRVRVRVAATDDLLRDEFGLIREIEARGATPLARIMSLVQFGDYLSCRLAAAVVVDPVPVARLERLKNRIREGTIR